MFAYGDLVRVKTDAPAGMRPGRMASVVGITSEDAKSGSHFDQFPAGTICLVEFEDGEAIDVHESMLETLGD